ncbi:Bug family tripartite tricarboxylate transporter substrate binding protein [Propylenella binzhouense]|uniref:Tripartite-type tricarboxylate transporter receptor subunit TctC n=1 Tax=Propylenella binzhouense TaxID=2555902 RepID=A0A964T476_9HYPH|nr:tripartite tricarboxylate transporter substrate-binding protein [Propylenella binzhouense]MYZ48191.1 hypothetical protein [Propylenella binzhouense]
MLTRLASSLLLALAVPLAGQAKADSVEDFYKGKTVNLIIGYSVGGGYDTYSRVLAQHMGKHIPGNPTVVPQNMPGAGSLKAANYIFNVAPKDGTVFGTFARGLAMEPLIGTSSTQFDPSKFTWLGSIAEEKSVCVTWHTSPVKTWEDAQKTPFKVAGEGSGSDPDIFSSVVKSLFDVPMELVTGYPGTNEMTLAIERGEVDGRCGWSWNVIKTAQADWVRDKKLNILLQMSLHPIEDLPDVPNVMNIAQTDEQKQVLKLVLGRQVMGRPYAAPPGLPPERAEALRKAFEATMKDPDFLAEAEARGLEVSPITGKELDELVADLYATPKETLAHARAAIGEAAR